ncbi:MAG: SpoIIE family protein phosphatase [Sulfuritalea sp.]|nr:SpoIIE family protein phosphatase [Sulfuritalea sp.]
MPRDALEVTAALSIGADNGRIRDASVWLETLGRENSIPAEEIVRLDLCLNEALANVIAHGGRDAAGADLALRFRFSRGDGAGSAQITVIDQGPPFNPLDHVVRNSPASLDEAEPGGLGIAMIRAYADQLDYCRVDGRNHLSFAVEWQAAADASIVSGGARRVQRFRRGPERRLDRAGPGSGVRQQERRKQGVHWIPLFHNATEREVNEALGDSKVLLLEAATPLLRPGAANDKVYILLSGEIVASLDDNPDTGIPIFPGQCIGELSAIDGKPVSALVTTRTQARVLEVARDVFWNRLMVLPGVASNLMIALTERMRRTNEIALKAQREQLELIHLRKELEVARQLQVSMVPLQRPIFPDRQDIELCGFMEPAASVGGDLFDAFFVDERHLFFCIGDVSGHGIAAALFMSRTIGLMRVLAMNTLRPDSLLETLNDRLCIGNDTNIFVTLFCGILDATTGELSYSNGGHIPPILVSGGKAALLEIPRGALIGAMPGMTYSAMQRKLIPGDLLLCYTDGVTEAQDPTGAEYSEERCMATLDAAQDRSLPVLLDMLREEVRRFTRSDTLEDDCTMLALRSPA